jgi:hypothetical protein
MNTTKPVDNPMNETLNAAEQGKLWATYMGNTMSICTVSYMLQHVQDQEIRRVLEHALDLSREFTRTIRDIFTKEHFPVPKGFTDEDVNLGAPRLFTDEFYLHYLKYVGKAGLSLYSIAVPLMVRPDIRGFFTRCLTATIQLMNEVNEVSMAKGMLVKPPFTPYPANIDFVKKQSYLNGFFGHVRPLQAMEITHLYDNLENNATSKAILIAFSQVAKMAKAKDYFLRGRELAAKHYDVFRAFMEKENLSTPPIIDTMVTTSSFPPFSDKLMLFHKLDMYTMRVRSYGNALSLCARHDLAAKYAGLLPEVANYVEDGANILIDHGWLEQAPQAADRDALAHV